MSDLIGTVRREEHEGGFSIWAKVAQAQVIMPNSRVVMAAEWLCVFSPAEGNCGERLHRYIVERDANPVVGFIPGTPAADSDPCPYTHAHTRHWCGRPTCRES